MGDICVVAYRPKAGRAAELDALIADHAPFLRRLGLATDRPSTLMRGEDGVVIDVFEWADGAIARAHEHPEVLAMWGRYAAVCDYVPLCELSEARTMFAQFRPFEVTNA